MKVFSSLWMRFAALPPLRYIACHPFSIMALCNIVGDFGYVGFAFDAAGFVSWSKLTGAILALIAHLILLAHGDDQARSVADEVGILSDVFLKLQAVAKGTLKYLPENLRQHVVYKPVGISFIMLALNGVGLVIDGALHQNIMTAPVISQITNGILIAIGCGCFAAADFVKDQRMANILLRVAPSILSVTTLMMIPFAISNMSIFLMISMMAFIVSNFAGFFTRIDKEKAELGQDGAETLEPSGQVR